MQSDARNVEMPGKKCMDISKEIFRTVIHLQSGTSSFRMIEKTPYHLLGTGCTLLEQDTG